MVELIVDFAAGTSEDTARVIALRAGGTIRRRMRTGEDTVVRLLVQLPDEAAAQRLSAATEVARTEPNSADYGTR